LQIAEETMVKTLTSAEPGALLKVGASKDNATIAALKERTGVDRKTLNRIQQGKPVKHSTLLQVARKLAVPVSRLLPEQSLSGITSPSASNTHPKTELQLKPLDTAILHEMLRSASTPADISWHIDLLSLTQRQEELLLDFENKVGELDKLVNGYDEWNNNKHMSLKGQLAKLRLTSDIEESIGVLKSENIGVFGALDTWWLDRDDDERCVRTYDSMTMGVIGFAAAKPKTLTIPVTDASPPTTFDHLYPRIRRVFVDDKLVWERNDDRPRARPQLDDDIPF
jgi:hypothetical protein